jgi:hypothetical protein
MVPVPVPTLTSYSYGSDFDKLPTLTSYGSGSSSVSRPKKAQFKKKLWKKSCFFLQSKLFTRKKFISFIKFIVKKECKKVK